MEREASAERRAAGYSFRAATTPSRTIVGRHDLHRDVANGSQKPVDRRPAPDQLPSGSSALTEDHVRDRFALGEGNEAIGGCASLDAHDARAKALCQSDVVLKRLGFTW